MDPTDPKTTQPLLTAGAFFSLWKGTDTSGSSGAPAAPRWLRRLPGTTMLAGDAARTGTGPVCCEDGDGGFSSVCPIALLHGTEAEEQPLRPLGVPPGYGTGDMRTASAWASRAVFSGRTQMARRCRVEEGGEKREQVSFPQQDLLPCAEWAGAPHLCPPPAPMAPGGGCPTNGWRDDTWGQCPASRATLMQL